MRNVRPAVPTLLAVALAVAACSGTSTSEDRPDSRTPSSVAPLPAVSRVDAKIPVGGSPCGITDAAGSIWVSDADKARLLRIDPRSRRVELTGHLDPSPCEITVAYGSLWVVTQSGHV